MNTLHTILNSFESITLSEMDNVKLMDRTDRKFCFHFSQLEEVLGMINNSYKILEVAGNRISRYQSLYYDTVNFDLYKAHHNGKLNRYKIRHRTYVESNLGFMELKYKNNKGRTIKNRIKNKTVPQKVENEMQVFIESKSPVDANTLIPVLWVNYNRITLVNKWSAERLTLDLNLEFVKGENKNNHNALVIAEVKQDKKNKSPFFSIVKKMHIQEGSISKYCMGIATTYEGIKKNNFKSKLKSLSHLLYDNNYITSGN